MSDTGPPDDRGLGRADPEPPAPWPPVYVLPGAASIRSAALYDGVLQLTKRTMWLESVVNTIVGNPNPPAWNYLTEAEADLRYPLLTAPDPYPQYLTPARADARYLALSGGVLTGGLTLPQGPLVVDPDPSNALVWGPAGLLATGGVGTTDVTINGSSGIGAVESPLNTFALTLRVSPDALNTLALRANGLYGVPADLSAYSTTAAMNTAISASMTTHTGAADPHPTYYNQVRGDARYLQTINAFTQALADARYEPLDTMYTKAESDLRYEPFDSAYTKSEADARYLQSATAGATYVPLAGGSVLTGLLGPTTTNTRDLGTTALRWAKLWAVNAELTNLPTINGAALSTLFLAIGGGTLTGALTVSAGGVAITGASTFSVAPTVGGSPLLTQTAGDARYLLPATAASTYVPLAGGSVLTGSLGPTTTNAVDLGTSLLRWRKAWAVDEDLSGSLVVAVALTVAAKAVALSPNANQSLQWLANGFFSDAPTKATYDALVARVTALEGQMGAGTNGHYHAMGTWRQTAKATLPATVLEEAPAA
jgi:hypothetical protein